MAAHIARIYKNVELLKDGTPNPKFEAGKAACWMEWLLEDEPKKDPVFTTNVDLALLFPSHGVADDRAIAMREQYADVGHVFATSCARYPAPPPSVTHRPPCPPEIEPKRKPKKKEWEHLPTREPKALFGYDD